MKTYNIITILASGFVHQCRLQTSDEVVLENGLSYIKRYLEAHSIPVQQQEYIEVTDQTIHIRYTHFLTTSGDQFVYNTL